MKKVLMVPRRFPAQLIDRTMSYGSNQCEMMIQPGLGPLPYNWAMNLVKRSYQQNWAKGKWAHAFTNTGPIDSTAVSFGSKPSMARLLPPPFYPPLFIVGISGFEGTLTLSSGVYSIQKELAERFLDKKIAELPKSG